MHLKKTLLAFLLFMPFAVHAQLEGQAFIDSLVKRLPTANEDKKKILILRRLSFEYATINTEIGIKYGLQALELAEKLGSKGGMAMAYNELGTNYDNKSDWPKALEYYFKALNINEELGDKKSISVNYTNISTVYKSQGNYSKALEYEFKSLELLKATGDSSEMGADMVNISTLYLQLGNHKLALEYALNGLRVFEKQGSKEGVIVASSGIAGIYGEKKEYATTLEYYFRALKVSEEIGSKQTIATSMGNIGATYLELARDTTLNTGKAQRASNLRNAITFLQKSIVVCKEVGLPDAIADFQKNLAEAYVRAGNYKNAFENYQQYVTLKDSIFSTDSRVKIAELSTQRESDLKNKQIEINRLSEIKKRNEQILLSGGLVLLLVVVIVVLRAHDKQMKANKEKEELLRQKDMLMKEIHHRVKNNLQVISTLLDLQLSNIADETAKDAMTESNTRVRSISLIHQQLYQNENVTIIEFSRFAKDLLHQVTSAFHKKGSNITLKEGIPETVLDIDTAVPLGLILNELMTNSYKYAFTDVTEGTIEIALQQKGNDYQLTYKDSGPGLPNDINISELKSLGMKLIRSLSKQIGGKFAYDEAGKSFVITFKDEQGRKMID